MSLCWVNRSFCWFCRAVAHRVYSIALPQGGVFNEYPQMLLRTVENSYHQIHITFSAHIFGTYFI